MFRQLLESLELEKISDFRDFCATLSFYIEYNEKDGLDNYLEELKKLGLLSKGKNLYKVVRLEDPKNYKVEKQKITSASTSILKGPILDEMKDTITQYVKSGDFYIVHIEEAEGLDINMFYNKFFKGKQKELTKKYDEFGNQPVGSLYDSFKDKYKQKEFIIFGNYKVKEIKEL